MAEHEQMIDYSAHQELVHFISQSIVIIPTEHTLFTVTCVMQVEFITHFSKIHFICSSILLINQVTSHQTAVKNIYIRFCSIINMSGITQPPSSHWPHLELLNLYM